MNNVNFDQVSWPPAGHDPRCGPRRCRPGDGDEWEQARPGESSFGACGGPSLFPRSGRPDVVPGVPARFMKPALGSGPGAV